MSGMPDGQEITPRKKARNKPLESPQQSQQVQQLAQQQHAPANQILAPRPKKRT